MQTIGKMTISALAAVLILAMTHVASFAASEFEGVWKVADSGGKAFEITLAADGAATASHSAGMTGTWKEEGGAAVIIWNTGWTTKIAKDGDKYTKTAFKKGDPLDGKPANSSAAEKVK